MTLAAALAVGACSGQTTGGTNGTGLLDAGVDEKCTKGQTPPPPVCAGVTAPAWKLEDFQERSAGFKERYGPAEMRGKPLMVTLVSAWCPYCQGQVGRMEALRKELKAEGKDVQIVAVNSSDQRAIDAQKELVSRTDIPLFQDGTRANGTSFDTAFQLHGGAKDDVYIYDSNGALVAYLRNTVSTNVDLTTSPGYQNVKNWLLATK